MENDGAAQCMLLHLNRPLNPYQLNFLVKTFAKEEKKMNKKKTKSMSFSLHRKDCDESARVFAMNGKVNYIFLVFRKKTDSCYTERESEKCAFYKVCRDEKLLCDFRQSAFIIHKELKSFPKRNLEMKRTFNGSSHGRTCL